jgi:hypothetical protein
VLKQLPPEKPLPLFPLLGPNINPLPLLTLFCPNEKPLPVFPLLDKNGKPLPLFPLFVVLIEFGGITFTNKLAPELPCANLRRSLFTLLSLATFEAAIELGSETVGADEDAVVETGSVAFLFGVQKIQLEHDFFKAEGSEEVLEGMLKFCC